MKYVGIAFRPVAFRLRKFRGPLHVVAGYTDAFLGDYVTACGLTLPLQMASAANEAPFVGAPSRCGDCFPAKEA